MTRTRKLLIPSLFAAATVAVACSEAPSAVSHAGMHGTSTAASTAMLSSSSLQAIKSATARFSATEQATKAGYASTPVCVAVPGLGGMGFHWANFGLVDPVFDPLKPEVMLYAPNKEGKLKLVAVEYIVIDVGQPRPSLDGQLFDIGGTPVPAPHWSLHVWVHKDNPNGVFTPFNPAVSCPV